MPRTRTHPGAVLKHEFMDPLKLSARALAHDLHVPANRIADLVRGRRGVTADTAMRLARKFNTTPMFWLNLQTAYDLSLVQSGGYEDIAPDERLPA
jgi:addiction module HigA family antidote